jgi:hypothetical protein
MITLPLHAQRRDSVVAIMLAQVRWCLLAGIRLPAPTNQRLVINHHKTSVGCQAKVFDSSKT